MTQRESERRAELWAAEPAHVAVDIRVELGLTLDPNEAVLLRVVDPVARAYKESARRHR
jgi:hypothetical protein